MLQPILHLRSVPTLVQKAPINLYSCPSNKTKRLYIEDAKSILHALFPISESSHYEYSIVTILYNFRELMGILKELNG